ncbi:MAG: hypothetical protein OCD76_23680 [Reichenbachiella sp.]
MSIGSKIIFTYSFLSIVVGLFLPSLIILALNNFEALNKVTNDIIKNAPFILIQTIVTSLYILFIGNYYVKKIESRNRIFVNIVTILSIYILLFISCAITDGISNSFKYGINGFQSAITSWLIYGGILFLGLGLLNGILVAPFMGKK